MKKKGNVKFLNSEEVDSLIEGIENGDIIIGGGESPTPEDIAEMRKEIKKRNDAMSPEEKERFDVFVKKLRNEKDK